MASARLVYLVRHGIAAERGPEYPDDAQRPLTAEGKSRLKEIGKGLVVLGAEVGEILTSPFVRTRQTAEILAAAWPGSPSVVDVEALAVGGQVADACAALAVHRSPKDLAVVGHMPGIGLLAAELLATAQPVDFRKGAIACISLDRTPARGSGTLVWFATPRMLRLIAGARSSRQARTP